MRAILQLIPSLALIIFAITAYEVDAATLVAWGNNADGQASTPSFNDIVSIASGEHHSLALKSDGTVLAWGVYKVPIPITAADKVPPNLTDVIAVAGGNAHSMALKADGTVAVWGPVPVNPPMSAPSDLSGVVGIAAGDQHNLALLADGTVIAWGYNFGGQTDVPIGLKNVVAISAGEGHSLALKSDGTVVAWGEYFNGTISLPMTVPPALTNVIAIASGSAHALALKADGTVVAWGSNKYGQSTVPAGLSNVIGLGNGPCAMHSLVLKADGSVVAWGAGTTSENNPLYAPNYGQSIVPSGATGSIMLSVGYDFSLALVGELVAPNINMPTENALQSGSFALALPTIRGRLYRLEARDSLDRGSWTMVQVITGDGTSKSLRDTNATVSSRFYRVYLQ